MPYTQKTFFSLVALVLLNHTMLFAQDNSIDIHMPKVPDVPQVQATVPTVNIYENGTLRTTKSTLPITKKRDIAFSKRLPPNYNKPELVDNKKVGVGEINNGRVCAYLRANEIDKAAIIPKLEDAGFEILGTYKINKKGTIYSIIFTNKAIRDAATKKARGFAGSLRIVVDSKHNQMSINNPIYVMKAFMQDDYDEALALKTLVTLRDAFSTLKNSTDIVKFRRLPNYHFMTGMPEYQDMMIVANGLNKELLKKAKASKRVVYEQHLSNGNIILGIALGRRTSKFVKKTGYQNSGLLPYPVLIENNMAKILAPKYYIAVMYPELSMSEFMTIATVPGAIEKDSDKVFR